MQNSMRATNHAVDLVFFFFDNGPFYYSKHRSVLALLFFTFPPWGIILEMDFVRGTRGL
jgi:hypothetical protein